ncbi:MAG: hypothetical protein ABI228_03270 [Burkholderiaceae bacterium]
MGEELVSAIILIVTFVITVGVFKMVTGIRARRAMKREQNRVERERLEKSLQPPPKNKSKRRREQQALQKDDHSR